jgi:hypothetical protein
MLCCCHRRKLPKYTERSHSAPCLYTRQTSQWTTYVINCTNIFTQLIATYCSAKCNVLVYNDSIIANKFHIACALLRCGIRGSHILFVHKDEFAAVASTKEPLIIALSSLWHLKKIEAAFFNFDHMHTDKIKTYLAYSIPLFQGRAILAFCYIYKENELDKFLRLHRFKRQSSNNLDSYVTEFYIRENDDNN